MPSNLLIAAILLLTVGYFLNKSAGEVIKARQALTYTPEYLAAGRKASIAFVINVAGVIAMIVCFIRWAF